MILPPIPDVILLSLAGIFAAVALGILYHAWSHSQARLKSLQDQVETLSKALGELQFPSQRFDDLGDRQKELKGFHDQILARLQECETNVVSRKDIDAAKNILHRLKTLSEGVEKQGMRLAELQEARVRTTVRMDKLSADLWSIAEGVDKLGKRLSDLETANYIHGMASQTQAPSDRKGSSRKRLFRLPWSP